MAAVTWDRGALHQAVRDRNRLAALRRLLLLDSPPSVGFDRITRLTAELLGAPIALLSLIDADRQWIASNHGLPDPAIPHRQVPLSHSVCQHVVAARAPLAVEDAREEPALRDHPLVVDIGLRAYAGSPVLSPDGHVVGALCAADPEPRAWTARDLELLDDLAALATREVALHVHERREAHRRLWSGISLQANP